MKKEDTPAGLWEPAQIPGPVRPLESHYNQTLLQHFPKTEEGKLLGRRGGGYTQRACA